MVFSVSARKDVDEELLTKDIIYRKFSSTEIRDLATDETALKTHFVDYSIPAQVTIQRFDSKYVQDGILIEGDLVGLFRYEYTKQINGTTISPVLVPKTKDMIKFLNQWYSIKQCTPATLEDSGVLGWDFTAGQATLNNFDLE